MNIDRQNEIFQQNSDKYKKFNVGSIVGLKIANVDRSNTAPSILPCRIIEIVAGITTSTIKFRVATETGIINTTFLGSDLINLEKTLSTTLRQIEISNLPSISIIQACQEYTKFRSITACKCATFCDTSRCPCKKRSVKCCSKCHHGKQRKCKNRS